MRRTENRKATPMKFVTNSSATVAALIVTIGALCGPALADDAKRRAEISAKGIELFRNTSNHCHAYRDLVEFSTQKVENVGQLLEDLKLVLIGESLTKRGTGKYYIGNTPGARGDSGFKSSLRDGSPQVEHSWAAIYIGKAGPGAGVAAAALTEAGFNQDALLWVMGADAGARLSQSNFKQLPKVIERTQCE